MDPYFEQPVFSFPPGMIPPMPRMPSSPQATGFPDLINTFAASLGLSSLLAHLSTSPYLFDTLKLFLLGTIVETGRRLIKFAMERYRIRYTVTAQFYEGDPAYEWMTLFMTEQNVWRRSRDFRVSAKNSNRQWNVSPGQQENEAVKSGNAQYIPTFSEAHLFRWKGYWLQFAKNPVMSGTAEYRGQPGSSLHLTIYSLQMSVLTTLVEEARLRYVEVTRPNVTIHLSQSNGHAGAGWGQIKTKLRRPLSSIILEQGVIESLIEDASEFLNSENWYVDAGIPHRRGYLLYGPPGTGKSSTIEALAGELGVEIYSLSLSSGYLNDSFLQAAVSGVPKRSILLLEDIDCAFPTQRDDTEDDDDTSNNPVQFSPYMAYPGSKSGVTLSGLLNIIDGIGSEEGKLFIATTNHIERLDPALLRPGRIDKRIEYTLASKNQALALFNRFFPTPRFAAAIEKENLEIQEKNIYSVDSTGTPAKPNATKLTASALRSLAESFSAAMPELTFSTAELQGYLLSCKSSPEDAVKGIKIWADEEEAAKKAKADKEKMRKEKAKEKAKERSRMFGGYPAGPAAPMFSPSVFPETLAVPAPTTVPSINNATISTEENAVIDSAAATITKVNGVDTAGTHRSETTADLLET